MFKAGSVLGERYRIIEKIGKGGMGQVYLAEDLISLSKCAIKAQQQTDRTSELIFSEINIQERLHHPALPQIIEVIKTEGYICIVMEYIDGTTLDNLIHKFGCFKETDVLDWAKQLADILTYLHGLKEPVVYRDLKPSNIILDAQGKVHLIDFGIAQEYQNTDGNEKSLMTLTRGYAAPEQYSQRYRADVRTDIYSLGVTLHYLLTGKNPLKPPYHFERVRKLKPDISYAMEAVIKKCLQPNPDNRYAKAELLKADLENIQENERRLRSKRKQHGLAVCGTGILAILLLTVVFFVVKNKRSADIEAYYALIDRAGEYAQEEIYADALEKLEEAITMQPDAEEAYLAVAQIYKQQERFEECFSYISNEVVVNFPDIYDNLDFLELMGELYLSQNNQQEAEFYFQRLYENDTSNMEYLYNLLYCRICMGKTEEVQEQLEILKKNVEDRTVVEELEKLIK